MNTKETACILLFLSYSSIQMSQTGVYTSHGMDVKCHGAGDAQGQERGMHKRGVGKGMFQSSIMCRGGEWIRVSVYVDEDHMPSF